MDLQAFVEKFCSFESTTAASRGAQKEHRIGGKPHLPTAPTSGTTSQSSSVGSPYPPALLTSSRCPAGSNWE